jgi:arsenite methyltransferase
MSPSSRRASTTSSWAALWPSSGLRIEQIRDNPYEFISDRARNASAKYGVKSVSLVAIKPSN